jgi:hypothetical protein
VRAARRGRNARHASLARTGACLARLRRRRAPAKYVALKDHLTGEDKLSYNFFRDCQHGCRSSTPLALTLER